MTEISRQSLYQMRCPRTALAALVACVLAVASGCQPAGEPAATQGGGAVDSAGDAGIAATLNGQTISLAELDKIAIKTNMEAYQSLYQARRTALEQMIDERLIAQAAASRGSSVEEVIAQEIDAQVAPASADEVKQFFEENKPSIGEQTLEQIGPRIEEFLNQRRIGERRQAFMSGLREQASVSVTLDPPRAEVVVLPQEPALGPETAPITLVEYADYQCPFCTRVRPALKQIAEQYGDRVRIVYRDYPLPMHPQAQAAAEAARCAHAQGKFWPYHDKMFDNQQTLEDKHLKQFASDVGLDKEAFGKCLDSRQFAGEVSAQMQEGSRLGVTGTPAFFINGRFLSGAQPFEAFQQVIEEELQRASDAS